MSYQIIETHDAHDLQYYILVVRRVVQARSL